MYTLWVIHAVGMVEDKDLNKFLPKLIWDFIRNLLLEVTRALVPLNMCDMLGQGHIRNRVKWEHT